MTNNKILIPKDTFGDTTIFTGPKIGIIGKWFDVYTYIDGSKKFGQHGEFEWGSNQIQNSFASLLASWCRAESGYDRINYIGVGHGNVSWDTTPPTQSYDQTTLTDEFYREAIAQPDIVFIDKDTDIPTGGTPSSKIEITINFAFSEANGILREFGLFGGTATASLNSGEMVYWITHQRIDKDSSIEIQRKVRIEFVTL